MEQAMNGGKEEVALDERHVQEAREWVKLMVDSGRLPVMTISELAGIKGAAIISKFYGNHHMSDRLTRKTAAQILNLKSIFEQATSFK